VLDAFACKSVGCAIDRRPETILVAATLNVAATSREIGLGTIIHADQGVLGVYQQCSNLRWYDPIF